jgi:hypothetical protein
MTLIPVSEAVRWIRTEYLQLPGLSLTRDQAQRLCALDPVVCAGVLDALVDIRFLERTTDGRYVRADVPTANKGRRAGVPRRRGLRAARRAA